MNPVSLAMDGVLAVLLLSALTIGMRLNGRLKTLRASQGDFVKAVADLDGAAARAEAGLSALRAATQEAHDALLSRIETARALAPRLETATAEAASAAARLDAAVREAEAAGRAAQAAVAQASAARTAARPAASAPAPPAPAPSAPAVAEAIPFPRLRDPAEEADAAGARGLAAALAAAERIVATEAEPGRRRRPDPEPLTLGVVAPASSRLASFVARRQGAASSRARA